MDLRTHRLVFNKRKRALPTHKKTGTGPVLSKKKIDI
jgi:hypothetical protein